MIVNIHEAKTNFSKLIARLLDGEKIVIAKNGKPVLQYLCRVTNHGKSKSPKSSGTNKINT